MTHLGCRPFVTYINVYFVIVSIVEVNMLNQNMVILTISTPSKYV